MMNRQHHTRSTRKISLLAAIGAVFQFNDVEGFVAPAVVAGQGHSSRGVGFSPLDASKMSEAIPFLKRPKELTGELAGDFGFDPLGLAKNREALFEYREAEVKHARLAMLAAAGWPLSELYDKKIAAFFNVEPAVDAGDRVPSLLNGGLDKISPLWWGFCIGLTAAIDLYGVQRARSAGTDSGYIPGDLGFDPFGFYPNGKEEQMQMQLAEIKHGRTAMVAVVCFALQEAVSKEGVVDETPLFFLPFTQTLRTFLEGLAH
uniref:Uncharacterized protein n=1 Tax=Odontella aurita TaxID=265563 RepID=A0A6U6CCB4_9STRA|mmetsp:Transcript_12086/g.35282  ORF Transcript_12086/g.35282 Transcript_12086/m.35282 type:complete len:260 (+) Transcript_12086:604-1383(+)|eukprot:CAMPEP_0113539084 /NCGR_PEP_ID=MMETSP0015_2-20120614/7726_1 /TAXON_ID=2838 /ORGANISM="Odontella" /LENGTH=259 /DNA_ID=CAMNT_0000438733 /DNA_START=193 /DNA_END=972 /DNA_ORIENTATION=- /assembly_acc=CAM_ASM_000160